MNFKNLFKPKMEKYQSIDCDTMENYLKDDNNAVILDVRTPVEFKTGAIPNAINIDIYNEAFINSINKLDKQKTYYVYCQAGSRSAKACELMSKHEFKNVYNLTGGISYYKKRKTMLD